MAASVAEVLLRIRADAGEAKRELTAMAKQVQQFDSADGTATADVDTEQGERKLKDLFGKVARWAREKATAKVAADTSDATSGIRSVAAQAAALDAQTVDVKVKADTAGVRDGFRGLATDIRATGTNLTALLVPGLIGAVGALVPAVTVLATAAAGLGALAVAAVGAGAAFGALAAGAVVRFKNQADQAGTAANRLKDAAKELQHTFVQAAAVGIDKVFGALAGVFRAIVPQVTNLRGAFTTLGGSIATAIRGNTPGIQGLVANFGRLVSATAPLAGPVVASLVAIGRILTNIATAAMPFLVDGARAAVRQLRGFREATSDIGAVRLVIAGMVSELRSVARLGVALGQAVVPVFTALHGSGRDVVSDLTRMVDAFTRWASTAEGQKQIATFFSQTFFSVRDLGRALAAAAPLAAGFMESFGGIQTIILRGVTHLLELLNDLPPGLQGAAVGIGGIGAAAVQLGPGLLMMARLRNIEAALTGVTNLSTAAMVRQKVATLASAVATKAAAAASKVAAAAQWLWNAAMAANPIGLIVIAIIALVAALVLAYTKIGWFRDGVNAAWGAIKAGVSAAAGAIASAAKAVAKAVADVAGGIASNVRGAVGDTVSAAKAIGNGIARGVASVAGAIRDVVKSIVERALAIIRGYISAYKAVGTAIFNAVRNGIASVAGAIRDAARSIIERVVAIVRGYVSAYRTAGTALFNAVRNGIASVANAVRSAASSIIGRVIEIIRAFVDNARAAGTALFVAVNNGAMAVGKIIYGNVRDLINNAVKVVTGLASAFFNAGKALVQSLANGIAAGANAAIGQLKNLAGKLRSVLPFSEPKDPTSPLRGLGGSGHALVENFAAGIARAAPLLSRTVATTLGGITAQLGVAAAGPAVNIPALMQPSTSETTWNFNLQQPSGYGPQSDGFESFARLAQIVRDRGGLA